MKRQFSCLIMLVMLLLKTSSIIEGSAFASKAVTTASGRAVTSAESKVFAALTTEITEAGAKSLMKSLGQEAIEALAKEGMDSSLSVLAQAAKKAAGSLSGDALQSSMAAMGKSAAAIEKIGGNFAKMGDDIVSKIGQKDFTTIFASGSDDLIKTAFNDIGVTNTAQVSKLTSLAKESASALDNVSNPLLNKVDDVATYNPMTKNLSSSADNASKLTSLGDDAAQINKALADDAQLQKTFFQKSRNLSADELSTEIAAKKVIADPTASFIEKEAATQALQRLEMRASSRFNRLLSNSFVEGAVGLTGYALITMSAAILFMIPSLFQAAFLAQQQRNALLQTYIPPIKFGNIVMQIPDEAFDLQNILASKFIYYGIPVNNPGDKLSKSAAAMYPGVSGPTNNNKISQSVDNTYAKAFSLGAQKGINIARYNLDAKALASLPIFGSYTDASWDTWCTKGIPDPTFTQMMIDLSTGYIFYADGTSQGTQPAQLLGAGTTGKTVESFLATKYGELKSFGTQRSYTEYVDTYATSKVGRMSSPLAEQFNCKCLQANNGVVSADTIKTCSTAQSSSCLLTKALNQLAAGLVINSQGTVMTPDQDLDAEIAQGALGQVIPIQGYGDQFDKILAMFPGSQQQAIANSGVLTVSIGTNLDSASKIKVLGADPDNYTAKGIYIYQCQNTPFAKMLKNQAGGNLSKNYNNVITDYIVFLDQNLNQVPLMTPQQDPSNYNFIKMSLNPAIKYVSSIIGNIDENGNFSFLPQLNIQSSQALIAKGLPTSFPPLYGLQAKNGTLAINYNQNLTSVIGTIVQTLMSNPKLGQQFRTIQSAMLGLLSAGPFGKYKLSSVDSSMQPVIGGVNLVLYTGFNSYPVPQGSSNASCTDVLIPLSAQGKTVVLPSNNVVEYYGLVTDLIYTVSADGTITVADDGFENSPLVQSGNAVSKNISWSIDQSKVSQFYWLNQLIGMGQKSDPNFTMPQALTDFISRSRSAWLQWLAKSSNIVSAQQSVGTMIPGTSTLLQIVDQQAMSNNLFVYTCSPSPSNVPQDFFVLTNSSKASLADKKLGTMSVQNATAATYMLSLVTGQMYNAVGAPVTSSVVDAKALVQFLYASNSQAFSDDFKESLNIALSQSATMHQSLVYPFMFGGLQLGIYQSDMNAGVYLYVDAAGATVSGDFQPSDYFICLDSYTNPTALGMQLSATTQFIVSLVSGQVYNQTGPVDTMNQSLVSKIISSISSSVSSDRMNQITSAAGVYATTQKYQQQQTAQMNATSLDSNGGINWSQSTVKGIIANLASQSFLQAPYDMIKQDPASGMYVVVCPTSQDQNQFIYTFFDVPNNFTDGSGKPVRAGATYDTSGNLLRAIQGNELTVLLQQYGVSVDSSGKQYLGANNVSSVMQLDPADLGLKAGSSGKSMIYSNDPSFPSRGIVSPIVYKNSNFYIYFNTNSQSYYAMQVSGANAVYIDMASGNVYGMNGQPQITTNPVAVNANGNTSDLLLPYLNANNFLRCIMKNSDTTFSDFLNLTDNFQGFAQDPATNNSCGLNQLVSLDGSARNVTITQMPFPSNLTFMPDLTVANQYNVYRDQSKTAITYTVNSAYQWQNLQLLPINMQTRAILNPLPADMYKVAGLILKGKIPFACVFANQLYTNAQSSGKNSYTMTSGSNKITVSVLLDAKTNVPYISILSGNITYNYQYNFLALSVDQLADYQQNAWKAQTVADVTGKVILVESLSVNKLSPVSVQSIVNLPADTALQNTVMNNLGTVLQDVENSRFVAAVTASTYAYLNGNGFVDLENGVLFDAVGQMLGYTLQIADMVSLLQKLQISVVRNSDNQAGLRYTGLAAIAANSNVTAASSLPAQASLASTSQSNVATANPAIVALQKQNDQLQNDINQKQASLAQEKVTTRKKTLQNAIAADKAQIAANKAKIAKLSSSQAQSSSRLLGRLGSQLFALKKRKK